MKALVYSLLSLSLIASGHAATTFVTTDSGNAAALDGDGAGTTTGLTLSAGDGGGTINLTTAAVQTDLLGNSGNVTLGMTTASMGVSNEKWGDPSQGWRFSFDMTVDFQAFTFINTNNPQFTFQSVAWKDDASASGTGWSFSSNGTIGTFILTKGNTASQSFDFSTAGVSSVSSGELLTIYKSGGASGAGLESFTITPVPEPSAALLGLAGLGLLLCRRRHA